MFRLDPILFQNDLMDEIDYHMACEEGFNPREVYENEFQREMEGLALDEAEIKEGLEERIAAVIAALTPALQAMRQNDPMRPALVQLANLTQSIQDLEKTAQENTDALLQAKNLLIEMKRQYSILKEKFEEMQRKHRQMGESQLTSFLRNDAAPRVCKKISHS